LDTWENVAAQKAQAASGAKYALQFDRPTFDFDQMLPFIYQASGQLMSDDYPRPMLNTPQVRKTLEWTVKLYRDGIAILGVIEEIENPVRLFASGVIAMWLVMGNWLVNLKKKSLLSSQGVEAD
jgi:ABC-type glycerol-3-phosphate transport system substrate-binding protein